ncbi:hypothetical protein AOC36_01305 [Erysipelothrix larvae]|uniref:Glycosyl transferase family 1 domain-containing protein n=1 Tax=Erysipelothrix larvae TaxID=1514105 RepID=A0A0X8GYB8_9FIRM|nr:glycosyltransferase [Erysipelothrix larvae]AMC92675.1 hypothetical protein AOC36_01305 [Erysipelothrix larvae]
MRCLFVHDHEFVLKESKIYSSGVLSNNVFDRYLRWCSTLKIMARCKIAEENGGLPLDESSRVKNVSFEPLPNFWRIQTIGSAIRRIKQSVKGSDSIIVQLPSIYGIIAAHYAIKYKKPLMVEVVGDAHDAFRFHGKIGKILAPYLSYFTRCVVKKADYVRYVTQKYLQERYPSIGKTAGYSDVNLDNMNQSVLTNRIKKINESNLSHLILGTIGPIDIKYKGQHYVIKALGQLKRQGYEFEYYLVGKGDNTYLKKIATQEGVIDKLHFLGVLNRKEIVRFLNKIDLYIQPSQTEGLPRALIEAMNQGCPVFGSNVGGIPELIEGENTFNVGDVNHISSILSSLKKASLTYMASENFIHSKHFYPEILKTKDEAFFKAFFLGENYD